MRHGRRWSLNLPHGKPGKPRVDDRTVISGILHVLKTGCRWRDVPPAYGPPDDYLQSLQSLVTAPYAAAHVRENGGRLSRSRRAFHRQQPCQGAPLGGCFKKGEFAEAIGRSRGGRTSKIPALADDRGSPVAVALTPGNVANITMAAPLLGAIARPKRLLADKAYDADCLRKWLKQRKVKAVIPSTAARRTPYPLDSRAYKRRNLIERMFCKLKNWQRLATRDDRDAQNYLSGLAFAAIMIAWI
jgi:transposase